MHKNFSFKGVVRSNDNILANEGECLELVNLRMVNGSLKPIPETVERAVLPDWYSDIYWHDKASHYICVNSKSHGGVDFYDAEWNPVFDKDDNILSFPMQEMVKSIDFVGYLVVCVTDAGMRYLIFADGTYRMLGERPPIPQLSVKLSSQLYNITTDTAFSKSTTDTSLSSTWAYNSRGYFDECISKANKEGHYIDRALFRFALRLYDGSYIYSSHIIYASDEGEEKGVTRDAGNLVSTPQNESEQETPYRVSVLAFKPTFEFHNLELENWAGIIVGVDIFTTGSIMGKKIDTTTATLFDTETRQCVTEKYEIYKPKELDELWNDISNASLFYKVAEYDIEGNLQNTLDDVSQANIVLQDALSSFEQKSSYSSVVPGCSYMFNNRLHIGALREYFFKGFDRYSFLPVGADTEQADRLLVKTSIKTQNGVSVVVNSFDKPELAFKDGKFQFPPYLMYPDARAFEMIISIVDGADIYTKTLALTPHKFLNQSQYLHKWYLGYDVVVTSEFASGKEPASVSKEDVLELFGEELGIHQVVYSSEKGCWTYNGVAFPPEKYSSLRIFQIPRDVANGDKLIFTITESTADATFSDINDMPVDDTWQKVNSLDDAELNVYEERENVMKVSLMENPFIFPAKCTYSMSQGKILAFSTNRETMSQGQFGEHPLYVFSNAGIQVLSVDVTGTVAYRNMHPVSNEVCLNPEMVYGTDSGVLYLGTQGVMLISGSRSLRLSTAVDDDGKSLDAVAKSGAIRRIASLYGFASELDATGFLDFMQTARVARFSDMNEIVFCNSGYSYCFIYSISGNAWSKMSGSISGFVKNSTNFMMFSHDGRQTCIHQSGDVSDGKNKVLILTRPYMFGTKLMKRIMQIMLHAYLSKPKGMEASTAFMSCYLLCSNDGVNFKIVTGCERKTQTQDVTFPYFPTCSYRYYMFALTGELESKSMITALEMEVAAAWNGRLR